jgi:Natural resistance-associated macrophage protein
MVVIDLLAYTAQFAGIVLGASLVGITAGPAIVAAVVVHSAIVLTRCYRRFEVVAITLSLALFAFVVLAVTTGPNPQSVLAGLPPIQPFDPPGYLDLVVATIGVVILPWNGGSSISPTYARCWGPAPGFPVARGPLLAGESNGVSQGKLASIATSGVQLAAATAGRRRWGRKRGMWAA